MTLCDCCRIPTDECRVMAELVKLRTPDGRKAALEEYHRGVRTRAEELATALPRDEVARKMVGLGVPGDAVRALQNPAPSRALDAAKRFVHDRDSVFLLLLGPPGVGKTVAAARVVEDVCQRFPWNQQATGSELSPCEWVESAELTRVSAFDAVDQSWVGKLRGIGLLVLDDAGDEGTSIGRGLVSELLMARYAKRRRTVIAANLTADAFKERYGDAVADRVRQLGITPNLANLPSLRKRPVNGAHP